MKISKLFEEVLKNLPKEEITELHGISFDARIWNPVIKSRLKLAKSYIKNNKAVPDLTIIGREYPTEYSAFPIDEIKLTIDPKYGNGAGYDERNSGYDERGKYVVYLAFGPLADDSATNHELRHAYEDYMRNSKGRKSLGQSKEGILLFGGDFEKLMMTQTYAYAPFHSIFAGLYYTSKIERSAFADTVYDSGTQMITEIEMIMRENRFERLAKSDPATLKRNWDRLKSDYKIPILEKFGDDYMGFIKWATTTIKNKGEKTLKKLRKVNFHRTENAKKEGGK